jgi:hypothetical protein
LRKKNYGTVTLRVKEYDRFLLKELAKNSKVTQLEKFEEILQFYIDNTKEEVK